MVQPVPCTWRGALKGARDALPYGPSAFVFGAVFGLAARDAGWLLALRARERGDEDAAHLLGSGLFFYVGWVASTALGYWGGSALGDPRVFGLDFILIAFFAAILASTWKGSQDLWVWVTAAATSLVGAWLLPGAW